MRPLAALLGILLGSAAAIFVGLALTLVVYLLLPEYRDRLAGEFPPLLRAVLASGLLSAAAAAAFVGELRGRPWRRIALAVLGLALAGFVAYYWPR